MVPLMKTKNNITSILKFFDRLLKGLACQKFQLRAVLACAELNVSNFICEYLRENEFLRKIILACLSKAQMGSIHEKNRGQKSRETAPLAR